MSPEFSLDSSAKKSGRGLSFRFGEDFEGDEKGLETLNQILFEKVKKVKCGSPGPVQIDHVAYFENKSKKKFQSLEKNLEIANSALKSMKYHKKITGPTLFSDESDAEKPGWVYLCDSLYSPHLEERYNSVIQTFQKQGQVI